MDFVDKYYQMDPETDFYCPYAEALVEGWRVITEGYDGKMDLANQETWNPSMRENALRFNQWGRVLCVTVDSNEKAWVSLAYDDGITRQVIVDKHSAWLVKKDSVEIAPAERTYLDDRAEMAMENAKIADEIAEKVGKKFEEEYVVPNTPNLSAW